LVGIRVLVDANNVVVTNRVTLISGIRESRVSFLERIESRALERWTDSIIVMESFQSGSQGLSGSLHTPPSLHQSTAKSVSDRRIILQRTLSSESSTLVTFAKQWGEFAGTIEKITNSVIGLSDEAAWGHFGPVFSNTYAHETDFSDALFAALRASLGGACQQLPTKDGEPEPPLSEAESGRTGETEPGEVDEISDGTEQTPRRTKYQREIRLANCKIGFATEAYRNQRLGFPEDYGMSTDSKADHACVIFRRGEEDGDPAEASKPKAKETTQKTERNPQPTAAQDVREQYDDVTAAVELKLHDSSCEDHDGSADLDLRKKHGPLGQALLYVMDVWHCLARRGCGAASLPVVILAGRRRKVSKRKSESIGHAPAAGKQPKIAGSKSMSGGPATKGQDTKKLCCLQSFLHIPIKPGVPFRLEVGRRVKFPDRENEDNYKEAVAIYLKTLNTGLLHAQPCKVLKNPEAFVARRHSII
jgi:hypothetical protein